MSLFSKEAFADETDPANQDLLTESVALARGGVRGIYNAVSESAYINFTSPAGTLWAFPHNNPGATLSASNWESLTFDNWEAALGSSGTGGPPTTVDQDAVLHLVTDDIYLDIRFTEWGVASTGGGSFSYVRSALTASANPDFNNDGIVDGDDFMIWQRGFGTGTTLAEGDADGNGAVDAADLTAWQNSYGAGAAVVANALAVPEPTAAALALAAFLALAPLRSRC